MRKLIIFFIAIVLIIAVDSCSDKRSGDSEEAIYKAKDYAISVFHDTMPENYTIIKAKGKVLDKKKDNIFEITLTYTIDDDDKQFAHCYTVSVDGESFSILEDYSDK